MKYTIKISGLMWCWATALLSPDLPSLHAQCPGLGGLALNVVPAPAPTLSAPAQLCPGATGTVAVNQTFSSYAWSSGGSGQSISVTNPGTYTVTVTNLTGCSNTATATIAASPVPVPNISPGAYACSGHLTLDAGAGYSSYSWSNGGGSTQTAIFTTSGTYTVTVTNAAGCTGTDEYTLSIPPPPVVNISGGLNICSGQSTVLSATAGFAAYSWTGGGNTASISVNTGGVYTVTVTDTFGCTDTETATVAALPAPVPAVNNAEACPGANVTLSVTNAPFQNYSWSNGSNTATTVAAGPGVYGVTVTAANGCTGVTTAVVAALSTPAPSITQNIYVCNGQLTLNAGPGFSTYAWNNNTMGQTATINSTGSYTVTVTNTQGCTGTDSYLANIPPPPAVNITGDNTFCAGTSANLNATPGMVSYTWSTGQTGLSISVGTAGTYTVTATDAFGCTASNNFSVSQLPLPQPVIAGPGNICAGATATFSTTTSFVAYTWSNGFNSPTITVNAAGAYTVTVTAANGCTGTDSRTLNLLPAPAPNITQNPYNCDLQLTLNAGTGFSSYSWSTGGSTSSIVVGTTGTYAVTVTAGNGCTGTDTWLANVPPAPSVAITGDNSFCTGGSANLDATPGLQAYTWNTGQTGPNISVTTAGSFTVTATDAFGCTASDNFTVSQLSVPQPVIAGPGSICPGATAIFNTTNSFAAYAWSNGFGTPAITVNSAGAYTVTVTAANGCTGTNSRTLNLLPAPLVAITQNAYDCTAQLTLNAGPGFSAYAWSGGGNSAFKTVNASGMYTVTVTNAQGCTATGTYFANIPAPPVVNITGSNLICPGDNTTLTSTPGFSSYLWSTASGNPVISISAAGNYTVTVTDLSGCTATSAISVSVLNAPTPNISGPAQICTGGNATFSVPGAFVAIAWSTGVSTPTLTVSLPGTYTVTVTAANGCTGTDTQTLAVANSLQPQITALPYACDGQVTLDAGTGFASYQWTGGQTSQSITVNAGNTYAVTVSDPGGCTGTAVVNATIPPPAVVTITGNDTICVGAATILSATTGLNAYSWSTGQVGGSIDVNGAGTYIVTATDAQGCTAVDVFMLHTTPAPQPVIAGPGVLCINSIGMLAVNGVFSQYGWNTGDSTANITITMGNTYTVTVTDAAGCTGTDTRVVAESIGPTPVMTQLPYACDGIQTLDAGAGFSSYAWTGGQQTSSISVNTAGTYSVTVTDAAGCTGAAALAISIPPAPQVAITGNPVFCPAGNTTLDASAGFAAYLWSTGQTTSSVTLHQGGTVQVTVTDQIGCTDSETILVTALPPPQPHIAGPAVLCAGESAVLSIPGNYPAYAWSTGASGASIDVTIGGTFTVTVTDTDGCTGTAGFGLTILPTPAPGITGAPYACDGQINLTATAGFPAYAWAGPNGSTAGSQQWAVTVSGTYTVTVSDSGGCSGTATVQVTVPVSPPLSISGLPEHCPGQAVDLMASSGFVGYQWSGGQTNAVISVDQTTAYTVTATDAEGCTSTASFVLASAPALAPQIDGDTLICPGAIAVLTVPGDYATYHWSDGANTAFITVSQPGGYTVSVTDAAGCSGAASIFIGLGAGPAAGIVQQPYACAGQITLDAGPGFAAYAWSTGSSGQTAGITQSGTYTVTVTGADGCSGTAAISATIPATVVPQLNAVAGLCPGATAGASVLNAPDFVQFQWNNGVTQSFLTGIQGGQSYTVTVTDGQGCTQTAGFAVALLPVPSPIISVQPYACNGSLVLQAGAGFSSYAWSGPNGFSSGSAMPSVGISGGYTVTVTNTPGCSGTGTVQATIPSNPVASISGTRLFCAGSSTTLTADGNFAAYAWSNGSNLPAVQLAATGTFTVTVTTSDGCTATSSAQVLTAPIPTLSIDGGGTLCGPGSATLTASGSPGLLSWSTGAGGSAITVTQAGIYTATVTDSNGCTATASVAVLGGAPVDTILSRSTCRPEEAGIRTVLLQAASGCDSVVTIMTTYQPAKPGMALDIEPLVEANIGQLVTLNISGNFHIDSVAFLSPFALSCSNCLEPSFTAIISGFIRVTAFDADGCSAAEEMQVRVRRQLDIYVPNSFQPGSAQNGFFSVFSGPEVRAVRNFHVFDRWGNALFSRADMPTNDPAAGWDGTFRHKKMQPGVYVYSFEVLLADGSTETYSGDVTIVE